MCACHPCAGAMPVFSVSMLRYVQNHAADRIAAALLDSEGVLNLFHVRVLPSFQQP